MRKSVATLLCLCLFTHELGAGVGGVVLRAPSNPTQRMRLQAEALKERAVHFRAFLMAPRTKAHRSAAPRRSADKPGQPRIADWGGMAGRVGFFAVLFCLPEGYGLVSVFFSILESLLRNNLSFLSTASNTRAIESPEWVLQQFADYDTRKISIYVLARRIGLTTDHLTQAIKNGNPLYGYFYLYPATLNQKAEFVTVSRLAPSGPKEPSLRTIQAEEQLVERWLSSARATSLDTTAYVRTDVFKKSLPAVIEGVSEKTIWVDKHDVYLTDRKTVASILTAQQRALKQESVTPELMAEHAVALGRLIGRDIAEYRNLGLAPSHILDLLPLMSPQQFWVWANHDGHWPKNRADQVNKAKKARAEFLADKKSAPQRRLLSVGFDVLSALALISNAEPWAVPGVVTGVILLWMLIRRNNSLAGEGGETGSRVRLHSLPVMPLETALAWLDEMAKDNGGDEDNKVEGGLALAEPAARASSITVQHATFWLHEKLGRDDSYPMWSLVLRFRQISTLQFWEGQRGTKAYHQRAHYVKMANILAQAAAQGTIPMARDQPALIEKALALEAILQREGPFYAQIVFEKGERVALQIPASKEWQARVVSGTDVWRLSPGSFGGKKRYVLQNALLGWLDRLHHSPVNQQAQPPTKFSVSPAKDVIGFLQALLRDVKNDRDSQNWTEYPDFLLVSAHSKWDNLHPETPFPTLLKYWLRALDRTDLRDSLLLLAQNLECQLLSDFAENQEQLIVKALRLEVALRKDFPDDTFSSTIHLPHNDRPLRLVLSKRLPWTYEEMVVKGDHWRLVYSSDSISYELLPTTRREAVLKRAA